MAGLTELISRKTWRPFGAVKAYGIRFKTLKSPKPPPALAAVVELAKVYGLKGTARTLRLDNYSLKKRIKATGHSESPLAQGKSAFLERIAARPGAIAECTVELEQAGGAKMRIQISGARVLPGR